MTRRATAGPVPAQVHPDDMKRRFQATHQRSGFEEGASCCAVEEQEGRASVVASLVDGKGAVPVVHPNGRPVCRRGFAELNENAMRLFGVNEEDAFVVGPGLGDIAEERKTSVLELLHCVLRVVHFEGEVVEAFAALVEITTNGGVLGQGLQKLQFCRAGVEKVSADLLLGNRLCLVRGTVKQGFEAVDDCVDILNGDADVFERRHFYVGRLWAEGKGQASGRGLLSGHDSKEDRELQFGVILQGGGKFLCGFLVP